MSRIIAYEVLPGEFAPGGLPCLYLPVLSPVWEGEALTLEYRDGERETLVGWRGTGPGEPCRVRVFWTRHEPAGPALCLAIGGTGGLRVVEAGGTGAPMRGMPLLALAESLIPVKVKRVVGPPPTAEPLLLG